MIDRYLSPWRILCAGALLAFISCVAQAQALNPVKFEGRIEPARVKAGARARVLVTARIDPGWHLYSLTQPSGGPRPTRITIDEGALFIIDGAPQQPKPNTKFDPNFQLDTQSFAHEVTFTVPVKAADDAPGGAGKLIVKVYFQACDDERCLPPRTRPVEIDVEIISGPPALAATSSGATILAPASATPTPRPSPTLTVSPTPSAIASPALSPTPPVESIGAGGTGSGGGPSMTAAETLAPAIPQASALRARGLLSYIWFAMGFGLLALLTPCVFPMIPITVSFFTKREEQTRRAAIIQALVYSFGIILTFTGLGLLVTALAGPTGINRLAANPWMNLFLTALFVIFALNLFGLFEIRLPASLLSRLDSKSQGGGFISTLLMGLTFTLTSFTCTAAFVGTVLVAATRGEWFWSAVGMAAFATAFALPFFLLALFPRFLQSLPRSGGWLNSVKVVMAFLELAAAFKFLSNVDLVWDWQLISRNLVLAAWIALAVMTTIYLLGKFQLAHDTPVQRLGAVRLLVAVFFLGIAFYLLPGLFGGRLGELDAFLPPQSSHPNIGFHASGSATGAPVAPWVESYEEALALARSTNKPVFLNFTGVTCTNCRWMENNMFTQPEVGRELNRFVRAELYTDRETAADARNGQLQETKFKTVALPLYVIVDPEGNEIAQFPGLTRDKAEFVAFLQAGATRYQQLAAMR